MAAALRTKQLQIVTCSMPGLLICGTKKEKKIEQVRSEDTYDSITKVITQCESDEELESPVASTSKDSSWSYCEGKHHLQRERSGCCG